VRKIKEVLRLRFELGLGLRAIARSCSIGLGTAHEYLQRAEAAGVTWPLREDWDEGRLETALFGGPPLPRPAVFPMPDFAELHRRRQLHRQRERNRFARKPKYRILTKPFGNTCRKKRRKNSVANSVILRCLPPCA
jgi:hypothetical protein